jgi:hypothetical protein
MKSLYPLDITGLKFSRLLVLGRAGSLKGDSIWHCKCECGKQITVRRRCLLYRPTGSCGCLQKEAAAATGRMNKKHGLSGTPEYYAWHLMMDRCYNPDNENYHHYGGRGIGVCERWRVLESFIQDVGRRPSSQLSLDRKDNNGNYGPDNFRWATRTEQARNTRRNVMNAELAADLKWTKARGGDVTAWCRRHGIKNGTAFAVTRGITWKEV